VWHLGARAGRDGDSVGHAFGQLLPLAVAAAVSMVPITIMIVVLLSPKRNQAAVPYLLGWVLGAAAVLLLGVLAAQLLPDYRPRQPQTAVAVLEILLGAAALLIGLAALRRRPASANGESSAWTRAAGSLGVASSAGIGVALNIRPKALVLAAAASLTLHSASLAWEETGILIAVYAAIATSTVVVPIVATLVSPRRMEPRLLAAQDWIAANGSAVTAVLMLLIGALLLGVGIANLS